MQSFALNFVGPNSFAIKPRSVTRTGAQFTFEYTQAVWSSVKINFWASTNPEVQVGLIDVGINLFIQPIFKPAINAKTAPLFPPRLLVLLLLMNIPLFESLFMVSILINKVELSNYLWLPLTCSKEAFL